MKVLVVEDDAEIAGFLERGLAALGHETETAINAAAAIESCSSSSFDAIVLDRLLPDRSGFAVLAHLRQERRNMTPVVMLSALGSVEDRIEGLQAGADDYLVKPFSLAELDARIAAVARRTGQSVLTSSNESNGLAVGRLVLDPAGHRARFAGESVALNRKEYSLLAFLMRHANRVVTRKMLLEGVWNYTFEPTTNIVESNLSRLRTRLQLLGIDPIETLRGTGYVLRTERCA